MRFVQLATLLWFLALPVRADIIEGGNLIIGQQGVIGGSMTVGGNAFSIGGSTFSVSMGSVSVGGLLKPSALGIQWSDGTVSTTAPQALTAPATAQTSIAAGTTWSNTFWAGCLSGSTVTLTTTGGPLYVYGSGSIDPNASWNAAYVWFLLDGAFVEGYSSTLPHMKEVAATSGFYMDATAGLLATNVSTGSHSLCLGAGASGYGIFSTDYTFGAIEIK